MVTSYFSHIFVHISFIISRRFQDLITSAFSSQGLITFLLSFVYLIFWILHGNGLILFLVLHHYSMAVFIFSLYRRLKPLLFLSNNRRPSILGYVSLFHSTEAFLIRIKIRSRFHSVARTSSHTYGLTLQSLLISSF